MQDAGCGVVCILWTVILYKVSSQCISYELHRQPDIIAALRLNMHPFNDLTPAEISKACAAVQSLHNGKQLVFKAITLEEPVKHIMIEYLQAELRGEHARPPPRLAYCVYYIKESNTLMTTWVDMTEGLIARSKPADKEFHGNVDFNEVDDVERMVLEDPAVQEQIRKLQLPSHLAVVAEAWGFGSDGVSDKERQYQVYMIVSEVENPDSNHYARPLSFSPVVDPVRMKVTRIELIPTGADWTLKPLGPFQDRGANEYVPEANRLRQDLKPLRVSQPDGPSFSLDQDHVLRWQKWRIRVGFNYREGVVLRDICYGGQPLFYRISLSDMTVPYADPRSPYHRKQAFDLGDVGAGLVAKI